MTSLLHKTYRSREAVRPHEHIGFDSLIRSIHVHRQTKPGKRGAWQLDSYQVTAVLKVRGVAIVQRNKVGGDLFSGGVRRYTGCRFHNRLFRPGIPGKVAKVGRPEMP